MSFRPRSIYVSHAALPSGLFSQDDWDGFLEDLVRERLALSENWLTYCRSNPASSADQRALSTALKRIEELRLDALARRAALTAAYPAIMSTGVAL